MKLTEADKSKITDWLSKKCGQMRCFCCGTGQWTLVDAATIGVGFDTHTTRFHYHDGVPVVSVACANCGHLVFFSAMMLGLTPDPVASENVRKNG